MKVMIILLYSEKLKNNGDQTMEKAEKLKFKSQ